MPRRPLPDRKKETNEPLARWASRAAVLLVVVLLFVALFLLLGWCGDSCR